jgi:Fe-S cluster assembly protein SufD
MITAEQQRSWAETLMSHTDADKSGQGPGWLIAARTAARQAVAELPVLDRKQEAWRYTSIEALLKHRLRPACDAADLPVLDIIDYLLPKFDSYRLVFANGRFDPHLSSIEDLPDGVSLGSLRAGLTTDPELLATWFGHTANHTEHVFTAMNTALVNDGVFVHVESQVSLDRPIEVIYLSQSDEDPLLMQPRNLIVLDAGAKAILVERFIGFGQSPYFNNNLTEISVGKRASLKHYRVQDESRSAYHLSSLYLSQQAQSRYQGVTLAFGGAWARTEYHTTFNQEGAVCELNGLYTVGDKQLTDFHLDVRTAMRS